MKLTIKNEKGNVIYTTYKSTLNACIDKAQNWIMNHKVKSIKQRAKAYNVNISYYGVNKYGWVYKPTFRI